MLQAMAVGKSMCPIINPDDKLYIEQVPFYRVKLGSIVVFYNNGNFISHRLIFRLHNKMLVKGDNVAFFDSFVTKRNYVGVVVKIKGKYGEYKTNTLVAGIINLYFLLYSFLVFLFFRYTPKIRFFPGRRFLLQFMK